MSVIDVSMPGIHEPGEYAQCVFTSLPRSDQRKWAEVYLRGLLTVRGKKTIRKMIDVSEEADLSRATQSLQQFISQSTWDWYQVRKAMALTLGDFVEVAAWVVNQAVVPKRGSHSVGVARRFVASLGKTVNCQVGIGLFLASDVGSVPVDWSLALDESWSRDTTRRRRAKIPEVDVGKTDAGHILDMLDRVTVRWGLPNVPVVAAICNCPDAYALLSGLHERGIELLVEIPASLDVCEVLPAQRGAGPAVPAPAPTTRAQDLAISRASRSHVTSLGSGQDGTQRVYLRSSPVRIPGLQPRPGMAAPIFRLYAQWSPTEGKPTRFWITSMADRRPDEVMRLALLGQQSAVDLERMEESFGLRDFEGRSYPGWHRHMTLVSAAYSYYRLRGSG